MNGKTKNTIQENIEQNVQAGVASHMTQDLKNSVLIVSLVANLFIFTAWLTLQLTTQYDVQISDFLFHR